METDSKKINQGFTLIELLVAMAILITLTSIFLANFQNSRASQNVMVATASLTSDLHKLQSFSLSSKDITLGNPSSQYYVTFGNANVSYSLIGTNNGNPGVDTTLNTITLPNGISIGGIQITRVDGTIATPINVTLAFKVPYARMIFNFPGGTINEQNDIVRLQLVAKNSPACSYVFINGITSNINAVTACP